MLDKKSLYWSIHFVIGFSKTCYRSLVDIEVGDVLLISNNLAYAVIYNTKICDLIYPEELKMADHFEYEEEFLFCWFACSQQYLSPGFKVKCN